MDLFRKLSRLPIALTIPAFAMLLVVFGIPIFLLFLLSIHAPTFSFGSYVAFFSQPANVRVLYQTLEISVIVTAFCILIGYPSAYLIAAASSRVRLVLIALVMVSYLTSLLARTYAWIVILGDRGLINNLLLDLGLISSPLELIYNRVAVYVGMVHVMLPMMILPLISLMMGIDKSLVAAARSMGARPLTAFWRVFLPLSLPGIRSGALLVFVICLGFYITPAALGGLRDTMLSTFIASQVRSSTNLAPTAASAFILLAAAMVVLSIVGLDLAGTRSQATLQGGSPWLSRLTRSAAVSRYPAELLTPRRAKRWTTQLYRAGGRLAWEPLAGRIFLAVVMFFLLFPGIVVVVMSFGAGTFLEFPPSSFSLQWYRSFFGDPSWTTAAWTSIRIGMVVTLVSTVLGTLAAYGLSSSLPRLRGSLTMVALSPISLPVIVVGIATYLGLVKLGLIGTEFGIVLAHSTGAVAYVIVIVSSTLANFDKRLENAAKSMRAGPWQTFRRVTLPLIRPGIVGGAVFAFLHSLDEVVITSLVGGLTVRTLPLKMWENMRHQLDPTIAAVASLLMLLPFLWLTLLYLTWWRSTSLSKTHRAAS
ncbi:ABC transporter permease subunit [Sinorhizobium meliloti]|uniref:ABC transporter permease subunit n=1 Tax=Rhizobium meliloti TaxID=382 RepID=UPI000EFA6A85|nr:ABC transporter permease subunit [Sinorhizobium meliloti]RMC62467.1 ABC transporter permease subunit [Sinorhizobium meliloti]